MLGYPSWTAYLADALDGQWKLDRDNLGEAIRFLGEQGMSQRAIARATGASKSTVQRELARWSSLDHLITGLDGKTYPRPEPQVVQPGPPDEESDEEFLARMAVARRTITIPGTVEEMIAMGQQIAEDEARLRADQVRDGTRSDQGV